MNQPDPSAVAWVLRTTADALEQNVELTEQRDQLRTELHFAKDDLEEAKLRVADLERAIAACRCGCMAVTVAAPVGEQP